MNDLVLIRKNLFRRKLRAILMIVSILIAFAIYGVLASFERAFNAGQDRATLDRLVVLNKINQTQPLPISYVNRVRAVDGVAEVSHFNWFGGYYQDPKNVLIVMAVEPASYMKLYGNDIDIAPEAQQAFKRERTGAIVGATMAKKWGWKLGDHVPISSNIFSQKNGSRSWDFDIVGIGANHLGVVGVGKGWIQQPAAARVAIVDCVPEIVGVPGADTTARVRRDIWRYKRPERRWNSAAT